MMQIFAWRTEAIKGYRDGTVAVAAADADAARAAIMADFDRWIRTGFDEHQPLGYMFDGATIGEDGYPEFADEFDREEIDRETDAYRAQLEADISGDPIATPSGILYCWGGE